MEREKFMQEARQTARHILEGKENGIMNLVQQAWAEGKRNAEVETLRQTVMEAFTQGTLTVGREVEVGYEAPKEPKLPTWRNLLESIGVNVRCDGMVQFQLLAADKPIPADIAQKLGIEPKEG